MAFYTKRGIELFIDVTKSEGKKRLMVGWQNPDGSIGGHADMTDLFFSIRDYWETTVRGEVEDKSTTLRDETRDNSYQSRT
jgi:hypothetical protein